MIAIQIPQSCLFLCPTFIYGALLQVRSEKKGGTGVGCVWRADAMRFSGLCGFQHEAQQLESEGSTTQPAEAHRHMTTQIHNRFYKEGNRLQAGISFRKDRNIPHY